MLAQAVYLICLTLYLLSIKGDQIQEDLEASWRRVEITGANCAVSNSQKIQCGASGIIQTQCIGKGCCWLPGTGPWCYYAGPSLSPTKAAPTLKPTTAHPSISLAPTPSHTNSTSLNSPLSTAAVAGVVIAGVAILAAVFLCYVYCKLYDGEEPEKKPVEESKRETEEKIEIQLTPYSGSQKTLSQNTTSITADRNLYSFYSLRNRSHISEYELRRNSQGLEVNEFFPDDLDEEGNHEVPVARVASSSPLTPWSEGRDRSFVTP